MRGTLVGAELRDSLARDWWVYTQKIAPGVAFLPLPNLGPGLGALAEQLQLSGLILSGGDSLGDYPERDSSEWALLDWARQRPTPVLGVCRGLQVLWAHSGAEVIPCSNTDHRNRQHEVDWLQGWRGVDCAGATWMVNSYHDQQVSQVSPCYQVLARSRDQSPEAIAHKDLPWLGIQWHPERENRDQVLTDALVMRFLEACQHG